MWDPRIYSRKKWTCFIPLKYLINILSLFEALNRNLLYQVIGINVNQRVFVHRSLKLFIGILTYSAILHFKTSLNKIQLVEGVISQHALA